jgi:hypothetical protein
MLLYFSTPLAHPTPLSPPAPPVVIPLFHRDLEKRDAVEFPMEMSDWSGARWAGEGGWGVLYCSVRGLWWNNLPNDDTECTQGCH